LHHSWSSLEREQVAKLLPCASSSRGGAPICSDSERTLDAVSPRTRVSIDSCSRPAHSSCLSSPRTRKRFRVSFPVSKESSLGNIRHLYVTTFALPLLAT